MGRVRLRRTGGAAQITFFAGNGFGFRRKIAPMKVPLARLGVFSLVGFLEKTNRTQGSLLPGQLADHGAIYLSIPREVTTKAPQFTWGFFVVLLLGRSEPLLLLWQKGVR